MKKKKEEKWGNRKISEVKFISSKNKVCRLFQTFKSKKKKKKLVKEDIEHSPLIVEW